MKRSLNFIYSNAYNRSNEENQKKMQAAYREAVSGVMGSADSKETIKQKDIRRSRSPSRGRLTPSKASRQSDSVSRGDGDDESAIEITE